MGGKKRYRVTCKAADEPHPLADQHKNCDKGAREFPLRALLPRSSVPPIDNRSLRQVSEIVQRIISDKDERHFAERR